MLARAPRVAAPRAAPAAAAHRARGNCPHAGRCARRLPTRPGRQARAGPARERIGLVETDVADRRMRIDGCLAVQREREPGTVAIFPVQRRLPAVRGHRVPAGRQPQLGTPVAAVVDERDEIALSDGAGRDRKRREPHAMARRFVVEAESVAGMADLLHAAVERYPVWLGRGRRHRRRAFEVCRLERIAREQVLEVGDDQLLVLLLVMQTQLDALGKGVRQRPLQQRAHRRVDVPAIGADLVAPRARQHAALGPRMSRADRVVVRIDQHAERGVKGPVVRRVRLQHEGLEEPRRVREVPLHGARVGHRLDRAVLRRKRRGKRGRDRAHGFEAVAADAPRGHRKGCPCHRCSAPGPATPQRYRARAAAR